MLWLEQREASTYTHTCTRLRLAEPSTVLLHGLESTINLFHSLYCPSLYLSDFLLICCSGFCVLFWVFSDQFNPSEQKNTFFFKGVYL